MATNTESIELLRARAIARANDAPYSDAEEQAKRIARINTLGRADLQSYLEYSAMSPRQYARLQMSPAEREADERAEARELAAEAQGRVHSRREN